MFTCVGVVVVVVVVVVTVCACVRVRVSVHCLESVVTTSCSKIHFTVYVPLSGVCLCMHWCVCVCVQESLILSSDKDPSRYSHLN